MFSKRQKLVSFCYKRGYRVEPNGEVFSFTGKHLKTFLYGDGYPAIGVRDEEGNTEILTIHALVAYQKFGSSIFKQGIEIRHLNGNKEDYSESNIALGTHLENVLDIPQKDRLRRGRNAGRTNSHLINQDVLDMREGFSNGNTLCWAMEKYGIAKSTASYIKNRRTYKYL